MKELKFGPPVFVTSISEKLRTDLLLEGVRQKTDARTRLAGHIADEKFYSDLVKSKFGSNILEKIKQRKDFDLNVIKLFYLKVGLLF